MVLLCTILLRYEFSVDVSWSVPFFFDNEVLQYLSHKAVNPIHNAIEMSSLTMY